MNYTMNMTSYDIEIIKNDIYQIPIGIALIKAESLWEKGDRGKDVVIAVLDTGCDITHPNLKERIIGGKNFTLEDGGDSDNYMDYNGHGTHVSGIISASMMGAGIVGVAPLASLIILKVSDKTGEARYSYIIDAIEYAISQKVNIISISLGGSYDDELLHNTIKKAVQNNILVVCAGGNELVGETISNIYPADYNECISVGAGNYNNLDDIAYINMENIDLVAPGVGILSTYLNGEYAVMSGTSMAVPHVTGALALLINSCKKEFGRVLSESEIYAQLIKRTLKLGHTTRQVGNGYIYLSAVEVVEGCCKEKLEIAHVIFSK